MTVFWWKSSKLNIYLYIQNKGFTICTAHRAILRLLRRRAHILLWLAVLPWRLSLEMLSLHLSDSINTLCSIPPLCVYVAHTCLYVCYILVCLNFCTSFFISVDILVCSWSSMESTFPLVQVLVHVCVGMCVFQCVSLHGCVFFMWAIQ